MSFPGQKTRDPWRMTRAVEKATFVQDVISAATHLLHGVDLSDRERVALELLRTTSIDDAPEASSVDSPQLGPTETRTAIRTVLTSLPEDPTSWKETLHVLQLVLDEGAAPDEVGRAQITELRRKFIGLARANFESISAAKHSDGELGLWEPLRTSSIS